MKYKRVGSVHEHVLVMEVKLGRKLIPPELVHHIDEDPTNNHPDNLQLCVDRYHHYEIHRALRAEKACGNPNWVRCNICGKHSDPLDPDLWISPRGNIFQHRTCGRLHQRERAAKKRAACA